MMSSYLAWSLLTLRKCCWKKGWVVRRRRKNLGIHGNSLSTAGRGVISREGLKQAISGAGSPPHVPSLTYSRVYQNLSLPLIIYLSAPQHRTLVQSPSGSVNLSHVLCWQMRAAGRVGVSVAQCRRKWLHWSVSLDVSRLLLCCGWSELKPLQDDMGPRTVGN